ncbi:MAG: DNA gyrase subunit A [Holosporaceae bacterium]|jgi:DNA gyrase subunit A|nr:DNA gyrase subunit A [Holosporaceae bacterium]
MAENEDGIVQVFLEDEMKRSYLDYAMSVIVSRALPDVCDGLKPVHRRIIFSMVESGYDYNKPFHKSANIVGNVMGKYHPHGDAAIYETMVRMAQPFSMREILIQGHGNFGSMDGDSAAAPRYTEARLSKIAHAMAEDLYSGTVDFRPNYDGSRQEPVLLPTRFPNLLVNGAGGIAVGMATNIPTHNLGEVLDACIQLIDNPDTTLEELLPIFSGPDFPTGGIIMGRGGILSAFKTGRGSVIIRGRTKIEEIRKERQAIVITEVPYQVNKSKLIERIASLANEKILDGIADLRDESDREGIRVVVELKKDVNADVILNQLYRNTQLQTTFGVNMVALHNGRPELMNLMEILNAFIEFRNEVVVRRTRFELNKTRDRAHILIGLAIAVANIDEVIKIIKTSEDSTAAKHALLKEDWSAEDIEPLIRLVDDPNSICIDGRCKLTEVQAQAILDLKLHRLTGLERTKISDELAQFAEKIKDLFDILGSSERVFQIIRDELVFIKAEFATPRKTLIMDGETELEDEDFIQKEDMVVTVSHSGYIKRVPLNTYRAQKRGGKGKIGMTTKDEDFVHDLFVANTHTPVLFFSTIGIVYQMKVYKLPLSTPQSKGKALVNLFPMKTDEALSTVLALPDDESTCNSYDIIFATSHGTVRRNKLIDFVDIRANGKIAMKLEPHEKLISVALCKENTDILISSKLGKCVRFPVSDLRVFNSRSSTGVRAIKLLGDDEVIAMTVLNNGTSEASEREEYVKYSNWLRRNSEEIIQDQVMEAPAKYEEMKAVEQMLITITEKGFAKRTSSFEYRTCSRGTQGVKNIEMNSKNGTVVAVFPVEESDEVMLVTDCGKLIRCPVDGVRVTGRATQGVILFRVEKDEKVVSAVRLVEGS